MKIPALLVKLNWRFGGCYLWNEAALIQDHTVVCIVVHSQIIEHTNSSRGKKYSYLSIVWEKTNITDCKALYVTKYIDKNKELSRVHSTQF